MRYKGYIGKVEFDDEASVFHGEVINTRDVITFEGKTVSELRKAFHLGRRLSGVLQGTWRGTR